MKLQVLGATSQKIRASAFQFAGAGTRKHKTKLLFLNPLLNIVEKRWNTLDLIDNDKCPRFEGGDLLPKKAWRLLELELPFGIERST